MKTIIHVNKHVIGANRKHGRSDPPITVKTYKSNTYCHEVAVKGECRIVHSPENPLSCGAFVWIQTNDVVEIVR